MYTVSTEIILEPALILICCMIVIKGWLPKPWSPLVLWAQGSQGRGCRQGWGGGEAGENARCFCKRPSSPGPWKKHFSCQGQSGSCSSRQTSFPEFFRSPYDPGSNLSCRLSLETGKLDQKALSLPASEASAVMRPGHQMAAHRPLRSQGRGGVSPSRGRFSVAAPE